VANRRCKLISAESGMPIFEIDINVEVPRSVSEEKLRNDIHRLADELRIDLVLRRA
jgi:glycine cleavage system regulatory protein